MALEPKKFCPDEDREFFGRQLNSIIHPVHLKEEPWETA